MLRSLGKWILDIMSEECERDECIEVVDQSEAILMEISEILAEIEEKIGITHNHTSPVTNGKWVVFRGSSTKKVKAKLREIGFADV